MSTTASPPPASHPPRAGEEIETLLGQRVLKGTTAVYAKYDADYLGNARNALATLFDEVMAAAADWDAGHLRTKWSNRPTEVVLRGSPEHVALQRFKDGSG